MAVSPGDSMTTSVYYYKAKARDRLIVKDNTSGLSWYGFYSCTPTGCGISTAEVVTEGNINGLGTSNFGAVNFTTIQVTPNGVISSGGPLTSTNWNITQLVQYGTVTGQEDVQPSALSSTSQSSSFTNTWLRAN
jgi:hypothetical protein